MTRAVQWVPGLPIPDFVTDADLRAILGLGKSRYIFEAEDTRIGDAFVVALAEVRKGIVVRTQITVRRRA